MMCAADPSARFLGGVTVTTKMKNLLILIWWLPFLGGCISPGMLNDLSLYSVEPAQSAQLKIEFTTGADISRLMGEDHYVLASEGHFCNRPRDYVNLMGRTIYFRGQQVSGNVPITNPATGSKFLYSTYLNLHRDAVPSIPQQTAFDLRDEPEDVCFYVSGGNGTHFGLKSNVVMIPKNAIAAALDGAR